MISQQDVDTLIEKKNKAEKPIESFTDKDRRELKYIVIDSGCPHGKSILLVGGLMRTQRASLPLVQKYDMGRDSKLGQMISDLNKYFKAERNRVNKDYDDILGQLSYKLNQRCVPVEFGELVVPLWKKFPDQEINKNIKAVSFVPYEEQIPAYKFEMVEYLCLASVIYGCCEYERGMPVLNETAKKMQELLYPALQQLNNPDGPQNYVERLAQMRFDDSDSEWRKLVCMANTTNVGKHFSIVLTNFSIQNNTPYERLVDFVKKVYDWREGQFGKTFGKYVMYPVLRLLNNALAPDVQTKADEIRKYQKMVDCFEYLPWVLQK